jgi:hypothetical protein
MPRLPMDYSRTIIYKIVCNDLKIKDCYVGATTEFTKRKNSHKHRYNEINEIKVYQFIRANGGWDNWTMVMIEEYPCKSKLESDMRERYWLEILKAELNNNVPNRTKQERYEDNKIETLEKAKEYRQENKELIKERDAKKYQNNKENINQKAKEKITCECGLICNKSSKSKHQKTKKHIDLMKIK